MAEQTNPFFNLANVDYSAGPPRDAMYSGFVPGANPMAGKAAKQRQMREAQGLTPLGAILRGAGEGYFGDVGNPMAETGHSVMDPSRHAPAGREAEMRRYQDIGTALGIAADPLTLLAPFVAKPVATAARAAENATVGALQRARIGRAAEQARRTPESVYNPLRERLENQGTLQYAVKPERGGNWLKNSDKFKDPVETALFNLKIEGPTHRDEALTVGGEWARLLDTPEGLARIERNAALQNWADKKLGSYIRNDMGTPNDPIRLAHTRGYSHFPGDPIGEFGNWLPDDVATARIRAGLPEEGMSVREHAEAGYPDANELNARKGEFWENLSDAEITQRLAGEFQDKFQTAHDFPRISDSKGNIALRIAERNPWLEKVPRDTPVYSLKDPNELASNLGFNHLMDELKNAIDPASGLPQNLRLTPKQLEKVTIDQAVERVSKINDWRVSEAEKAEREGMLTNLNAMTRLELPNEKLSFVDKPGMRWVDIPETTDESGMKLCTTIGRQAGWCTQGESLAKEYGSGNNRLTTLLDSEGRPHAQAMIATSNKSPYDIWTDKMAIGNGGDINNPEIVEFTNWVVARARAGGSKKSADQLYLDWATETGRPIAQSAQDITELKPVGNTFDSQRSREYAKRDPQYSAKVTDAVLQFLNSGNWGKVNDLQHYGIVDLTNPTSLQKGLREVFGDESGQLDQKFVDLFNAAVHYNPNAPRFVTRSGLREFVDPPPSIANETTPGYAEGGTVKSDFFIDPSSYAQSRAKQMFPKQKSEWTQQDAARHMLASGMMAQKFGPTVAKIAGLAHEHGNAPIKTIGYALGIGKMPPDYEQDLHNNALGVQLGKEATSQEDLESRIQAILGKATKQPVPGQPWIGRPNIPNQMSDYATGGRVNSHSTNPFDHLV